MKLETPGCDEGGGSETANNFAPPPSDRGVMFLTRNPEIQPTSLLALSGAVGTAPAAGLVERKVRMCLGVVVICHA